MLKTDNKRDLLFFNFDLLQERMDTAITMEEQYTRAYIAWRAGNGIPGKTCFASAETIAQDLGVSENTARKHIKILLAAKHIIELGYRSSYKTKQYVVNHTYSEWQEITHDFRNAFNNIESIKSTRRKAKKTQIALACFNTLSETQNLNPNDIKECIKEETKNSVNCVDSLYEESHIEVNNFESPVGECLENGDFGTQYEDSSEVETPSQPNYPLPPPPTSPPRPLPIRTQSKAIDFSAFDIETSGEEYGDKSAFEVVNSPAPTFTPEDVANGLVVGSSNDWDDVIEEEEEPAPDYGQPSTKSQPIQSTQEVTTPGKSRFEVTTEVEDQLDPADKMLVEVYLTKEITELEAEKPEPEPVQAEKESKTSPISPDLKTKIMEVMGVDCVQYLDYPYLLLKKIQEKREEIRLSKMQTEAEIAEIEKQQREEPEESLPDDYCPWSTEDTCPYDLPAPVPVGLPTPQVDSETPPPPPPPSPDYNPPQVGLNIFDENALIAYLNRSNVIYDERTRKYQVFLNEELMDRFFPLFAEKFCQGKFKPIAFDKFIEFCFLFVSTALKWETEARYNENGGLQKLIKPTIPSKFTGIHYREYTQEQLLDVAFRDNIDFAEKTSFYETMAYCEEIAFQAKMRGITEEEYIKKQREDAAKEVGNIDNWEEGYEEGDAPF